MKKLKPQVAAAIKNYVLEHDTGDSLDRLQSARYIISEIELRMNSKHSRPQMAIFPETKEKDSLWTMAYCFKFSIADDEVNLALHPADFVDVGAPEEQKNGIVK